jgi:hypothetical protein
LYPLQSKFKSNAGVRFQSSGFRVRGTEKVTERMHGGGAGSEDAEGGDGEGAEPRLVA